MQIYTKRVCDMIKTQLLKKSFSKSQKQKRYTYETLYYCLVNNSMDGRFYLLTKIHKRLDIVPGRSDLSSSGYYPEIISVIFEYHHKPTALKVKLYIQDTNDITCKLDALPPLPKHIILCTVDAVISILISLMKVGLQQCGKYQMHEKIKRRAFLKIKSLNITPLSSNTITGTEMSGNYAIIFMGDLEE